MRYVFHLVQRQYLETCFLHWYSENLGQHHSSCSWCHSGLTFNAHLKKLTTSLSSSLSITRAKAQTSWSWCCSTMVLKVIIRSQLDYAAPAWQSWLSATNISCLYPKLFCLTHYWPACIYTIRDLTFRS